MQWRQWVWLDIVVAGNMMLQRMGLHLMSHCNQFGSHTRHVVVAAVVNKIMPGLQAAENRMSGCCH